MQFIREAFPIKIGPNRTIQYNYVFGLTQIFFMNIFLMTLLGNNHFDCFTAEFFLDNYLVDLLFYFIITVTSGHKGDYAFGNETNKKISPPRFL